MTSASPFEGRWWYDGGHLRGSLGSADCTVVIEGGTFIWGKSALVYLVALGCALQVFPSLDSLVTNRRQLFTVHVLAGLGNDPFLPSPPVTFCSVPLKSLSLSRTY